MDFTTKPLMLHDWSSTKCLYILRPLRVAHRSYPHLTSTRQPARLSLLVGSQHDLVACAIFQIASEIVRCSFDSLRSEPRRLPLEASKLYGKEPRNLVAQKVHGSYMWLLEIQLCDETNKQARHKVIASCSGRVPCQRNRAPGRQDRQRVHHRRRRGGEQGYPRLVGGGGRAGKIDLKDRACGVRCFGGGGSGGGSGCGGEVRTCSGECVVDRFPSRSCSMLLCVIYAHFLAHRDYDTFTCGPSQLHRLPIWKMLQRTMVVLSIA